MTPLLTADDVAALLRIPRQSVYKIGREGVLLRPVRIGRSMRFTQADVEAFIAAGGTPHPADEPESASAASSGCARATGPPNGERRPDRRRSQGLETS